MRWWGWGLSILTGLVLQGCVGMVSQHTDLFHGRYTTGAEVYLPKQGVPVRDAVFIVVHGKSAGPDRDYMLGLYSPLTTQGYKVIAPRMPWGEQWDGTFDDGLNIIGVAIDQAAVEGKRAVLIGHDLGGIAALVYAADRPSLELLGVVSVAPDHWLHQSTRMQELTAPSLQRAREKVAKGEGERRIVLQEQNTGSIRNITVAPRVYLTYYDTSMMPDVEGRLPNIRLPLFWIGGAQDSQTKGLGMRAKYGLVPDQLLNRYEVVEGDHYGVLANAAGKVMQWAQALPRR